MVGLMRIRATSIGRLAFPILALIPSAAVLSQTNGQPVWDKAERARVVTELRSGDRKRIAAARDEAIEFGLQERPSAMQCLVDGGLYKEAELSCDEAIIRNSFDTGAVSGYEAVRAKAFLGENKPQEALGAAKAYVNACSLRNTPDAIQLLGQCLAAAHPDDREIVQRFNLQQMAGASTRPSADDTDDLGLPVLASIQIDDSPFRKAIDEINGGSYQRLTAKATLLLISDKPSDARKLFEAAVKVARSQNLTAAIENVARSIRAESGCVGPANAYVLALAANEK